MTNKLMHLIIMLQNYNILGITTQVHRQQMYGYASQNARYYADTNSLYPPISPTPIQHNNSYSLDRYAKFRNQPVNLSRANPEQNLNNSNIYTKQGLLKRNEVGWDAVKLTEYVTEQISQDYVKNQKMLDKFRLQAEQQRRKKKFGHALSGVFDYRNNLELPPISSPIQMTPVVHQPVPSRILSYHQSIEDDEIEVEQPLYRNVGVNTHKMYEKIQLQKYLRLMNKYKNLKEKYHKERNLRRMDRKRYEQKQEEKQEQMKSIEKIKHIESQLVNISTRLKASNQFLEDQLKYSKISQHNNYNSSEPGPKHSGRRMKTEPTTIQPQIQKQQNDTNQIPNLQSIMIPEYMPKQCMESSARKQKTPTVVYTNRKYTDLYKVAKYS